MHRPADEPHDPPTPTPSRGDHPHGPRHLHLDPFSGIAGDMMLAALLDLADDAESERQAVEAVLQSLELDDLFTLKIERVQKCGVGGLNLTVHTPKHEHRHDHPHHHHPHVGYRQIADMVRRLHEADALDDTGQVQAMKVVTALADAEARVHGTTRDAIHFHEVGAVDSIVDMLGTVLALRRLKIDSISCGPVPMSRGYVRCDHGLMPVPAPATAYLLQDVPTVGVDRTGELVTPTGAALLRGLVGTFGPAPAMTLRAVGYGAGDRDDPVVPNLLRVFLGDVLPKRNPEQSPAETAKPLPRGATTLV
jgi:uncharacterized protein (TIGR00299 family) protein